MVVTDPRQPDNPMVLANQAFLNLTGYDSSEIIGRNCRMLQGEHTSRLAVAEIRAGVAEEREVNVELLNYRKDGTTFWNQLYLSPIHDRQGRLLYFFASQLDVSAQRRLESLEASEHRLLREVDHRSLNALAIVGAIVRLSRADNAAAYASAVQARVQAVAQAHAILATRGWTDVPIADVIRTQVEPYSARRIQLQGPDTTLPGQLVQPLALVFHELAANAAVHGALSRPNGSIIVRWTEGAAPRREITIAWKETGGPTPPSERPKGFGTTMINAIVSRQLKGRVQNEWAPDGLNAQLTVPMLAA